MIFERWTEDLFSSDIVKKKSNWYILCIDIIFLSFIDRIKIKNDKSNNNEINLDNLLMVKKIKW